MKRNVSQRIFNYLGCLLILTSIVLNEYTLKMLFSDDGILEDVTRLKILLFNLLFIGSGISILSSISFRTKLIEFSILIRRNFNLIVVYSIVSLIIYTSAINIYRSVILYVASNIAIREEFYSPNNVSVKGTHWGGQDFLESVSRNVAVLRRPWRNRIMNIINEVRFISPLTSNFVDEYNIIQMLYELSKKSNSFRKETAIYIPKTLTAYWDMSCDTHMTPFIVPSISNMAMIEGLPFNEEETCYTHTLDYGYTRYYLHGKKAQYQNMKKKQICKRAKVDGFNRVIEITKDSKGNIIKITHECMEDI